MMATCNGLSKENADLKENKISFQKKYIELEISYDGELTNLNTKLAKQTAKLEKVVSVNDQASNWLHRRQTYYHH